MGARTEARWLWDRAILNPHIPTTHLIQSLIRLVARHTGAFGRTKHAAWQTPTCCRFVRCNFLSGHCVYWLFCLHAANPNGVTFCSGFVTDQAEISAFPLEIF